MNRFAALLLLLICPAWVPGQTPFISGIVNVYTPVTQFGCDSSVLVVGSAQDFNAGDRVLLIQMQGAKVDSSNSPAFGDILALNSAGHFELNRIHSIQGNRIQLQFSLVRSYELDGRVQLIRVAEFDNVQAANLTCPPWDGSTGGVVIVEAKNTLTLSGISDVSEKGFRGGGYLNGAPSPCQLTDFYYPPDPARAGAKGEGIARIGADKSFGRGRLANAGGGGNAHNAGGGGGANYTAGGRGGFEYPCVGGPFLENTHGFPGFGLATAYAENRLFPGGGGGAGQSNDDKGSKGGNGGGIVILMAKKLESNHAHIVADGENIFGGNANNDGQGGGGSGGTVWIRSDTLSGNLQVTATGGWGGNSIFQDQLIGPGGGGSGGLLIVNGSTVGISTNLAGGLHGVCGPGAHGAEDGQDGLIYAQFTVPESNTIAPPLNYPFTISTLNPCGNPSGGAITLGPPDNLYSLNDGPFQDSNTFEGLMPGVYRLRIRYADGCERDSTITLTDMGPTHTRDTLLCPGASITLGGITWTEAGVATDTLPATNGCDTLRITYILFENEPEPFLPADTFVCPGQTLTLGSAYPNTLWSDNSSGPELQVTLPGRYSATALTGNGCPAADTIQVRGCCSGQSIYIPNAFTPNDDGINDTFRPFIGEWCDSYRLWIYSRWGELLYEASNPPQGWDGTYRGKRLPADVFIWVVEIPARDGQPREVLRGDVTLLR